MEAQIKSLGIQDSAIQQIMEISRKMQPLQEEQMRFGIDAARQGFEQSQQDREFALGRRGMLAGLQNRMVDDAASFNTEDRREQLAGQAIGDVRQAFSTTRGMAARDMARRGVNPNDGRFAAMTSQMSVSEALGQAQAANSARDRARLEGFSLTDRAANALAGFPAMSMDATGRGAQMASGGLGLANQGASGMMGGLQTAGGMAGNMGNNATNMWSAQAQYKNQQDRMNQGDSFGDLLGGAAGFVSAGAKAGWFSDRRLKTNIKAVGVDGRTGLTLYEFSYQSDPSKTYRGVMADEVAEVMPEAVRVDETGYASVDYNALGIEFKEVSHVGG